MSWSEVKLLKDRLNAGTRALPLLIIEDVLNNLGGKTLTITNGIYTHTVGFPQGESILPITLECLGDWSVSYVDNGTTVTKTVTVDKVGGVTFTFFSLVSWANGTDEQIETMVQMADEGLIDLSDYWHVGDEREVTVNAINSSGTYDGISWSVGESQAQQTRKIILVQEGTYDLVTPVLNKDGTTRNKCSFIYAFDTFQSKGYFDNTYPYRGWNNAVRRNWCNGGLRGSIPSYLRDISKKVYVKTANSYNASALTTTEDYFTLPSGTELSNNSTAHSLEKSNLVQFDFNKTNANLNYYGRGTIAPNWSLVRTMLVTRSLSLWDTASPPNQNFICAYTIINGTEDTNSDAIITGSDSSMYIATTQNSQDLAPIGFI